MPDRPMARLCRRRAPVHSPLFVRSPSSSAKALFRASAHVFPGAVALGRMRACCWEAARCCAVRWILSRLSWETWETKRVARRSANDVAVEKLLSLRRHYPLQVQRVARSPKRPDLSAKLAPLREWRGKASADRAGV